jgi:AcrR family transcriptional regulator
VAKPRGRPRDVRVESAILDTALQLFLTGGTAAASFDGIAERAGVSRTSIYRRWRTRDDLLVAALQRLRQASEAGIEDWADRSLAEVIAAFEQLTAAALVDARSVGLLRQMVALDTDSPIKRQYWSTIVQPRRDIFTQMIVTARSRGELAPGPDPELLQDQLGGALLYRALMCPDPLDADKARRYVRQLLETLGLKQRESDES